MGWTLRRYAAVLAGITRPEQISENLSSVGDPLTDDDLTFVVRDRPHPTG
ncbi:hypothetical protein ACPCA8_23555 [Streptomyces capoamus]